ncbi:MAG TPA: hypothetical protein VNG33_05890 [Polyangiaceae bacterium]|nr:hypothetical protein [Polyangiaceae bacterium]
MRSPLILASFLLLANGCGGDDDDGVRCGAATVERAGECVLDGGGRGGSANNNKGGSSSRGGAGNQGGTVAGEGGDPVFGGSSSTQGGAATGGQPSGEVSTGGGAGASGGDSSVGGAGAGGTPDSEGGAPDLGESATVCTTGPILCTTNQALPTSGTWPITGTNTVVALSDTTVLVGNQLNNRLDVLDLCNDKTRWSWQLPASPGRSVFDRARRVLYVALAGATSIAKVSLDSARVQFIDVPAPAIALALGNDAMVFARLDDRLGLDAPISIIDGTSRNVLATKRVKLDAFIAFHRASNRLLSGSANGGIKAFDYAAQTMQFTEAESSPKTSYPCFDLALSPDQNHLFFACSSGVTPTPPAQGADFNPVNLASPFGIYDNTTSTAAATYSPGGARLFVSTAGSVVELDVKTHTQLGTRLGTSAARLSLAPSGRLLVGGGNLRLNEDPAPLNWSVLDTPDCKP